MAARRTLALLCHNAQSEEIWIALADAAGRFEGTDGNRAARWCKDEATRHADTLGRFERTDWTRHAEWCRRSSASLL